MFMPQSCLCFCKCHSYSDEYQVVSLGFLLGSWGALSDMCRLEQLQHLVCLEHDADDDDMIREDKALFPEVYDEGC